MHCIGCGDDISKIPSKRRGLCSDSVGDPGPGDSWRLCQKLVVVGGAPQVFPQSSLLKFLRSRSSRSGLWSLDL